MAGLNTNNGIVIQASMSNASYQGVPGLSAYQLAVQEGFEGTLEEWLESLHASGGSGSAGKGLYWCAQDLNDEETTFTIAANATNFPNGIPSQVGDFVISQNGWIGYCSAIGANIVIQPKYNLNSSVSVPTNLSSFTNDVGYLTADDIDIPTTTSALTNDSGFITIADVEVPTATSELTNDSGFITINDVEIPTAVSELTNDSGFITIEDVEVPTAVSELTNDSGFITINDVTLSGLGGIAVSTKGQANGVCPLDANGLVDGAYLPSNVDDVIEAYVVGLVPLAAGWLSLTSSGAALTPELGKIYIVVSAGDYMNIQYRWNGSAYVQLSGSDITAITNSEIDAIIED